MKDDIIFKKYIPVFGKKYKIMMIRINDFRCIQIVLFSKPLNILKKIFISFETFVDFSKKFKDPFD